MLLAFRIIRLIIGNYDACVRVIQTALKERVNRGVPCAVAANEE